MANTQKQTKKKIDNEAAVLEKVAAMPEPYRAMGERLHELILESAPELQARPWYGMPGYAKGSGPVLCFFRVDDYMTFGLTEKASFELEDGALAEPLTRTPAPEGRLETRRPPPPLGDT